MRAGNKMFAIAACVCVFMVSGVASAATQGESQLASADTSVQLSLVEDYSYPGADQIFEEHGIRLIKGDGNILLVACDSADNPAEVYSRETGRSCFDIQSGGGYLQLKIPSVYAIKGDDHTIEATITVEDKTEVVNIPQNEFTPVGEGTDPETGQATLLELRA